MKRGFTLVELLVTMGIMGFLGIAATSGYHALVRGMTERGICSAASSAMRAAKGRAQIDRKHTVVFCYNKLLREPAKDGSENGVAVGVLVAVRRVGRLSGVSGDSKLLYDEFGDLELCFESLPKTELERRNGVRLYKFNDNVSKMEYSRVADASYLDTAMGVYLPHEDTVETGYAGAYYNLGGGGASWKSGDGYGIEFATLQLQEGYIFGQNVPRSIESIETCTPVEFDPDNTSDQKVDIYSTRPNTSGMPTPWKKVGSASSNEREA